MKKECHLFSPEFCWSWLAPRYWLTWFGVGVLCLFAFFPVKFRDWLARALTPLVSRISKKPRRIFNANLEACFPEMTLAERQQLMHHNIEIFLQVILGQGELLIRSPKYLQRRFEVDGWEHVEAMQQQQQPVIFLTPHLWGLEYAACYFMCAGVDMMGMINEHKNPVFNWLTYLQRTRFGSLAYKRSAGIKAVIKGSKAGRNLFYLPDEDHGPENSQFTPFFATTKATLPVLSRIAKCSGAKVLPLTVAYEPTRGKFVMTIEAPLDCSGDHCKDSEALFLNQTMERLISRDLKQYMWILRILKTRPAGYSKIY